MELCFLRHGRSVARTEWTADDAARPLTEDGKAAMAHEAATLSRLDVKPDLIVTSRSTTARQTAEIIAAGLDASDRVVGDERAGESLGAKRLRGIPAGHEGAASIMVVGHEPMAAPSATAGAAERQSEPDTGKPTAVAPCGERALLLQEPHGPASGRRRPGTGKAA